VGVVSASSRPTEVLVALDVRDEKGYAEYRAAIAPLLQARSARFGVDVRVAEVLRSPGLAAFNRLFTLRFPSVSERDAFFADPGYLAIRKRLFEPSVAAFETLGRYEVLA
jgi:uncharacterized protein (DUF1330 family)